jgi:hypothetical protein
MRLTIYDAGAGAVDSALFCRENGEVSCKLERILRENGAEPQVKS